MFKNLKLICVSFTSLIFILSCSKISESFQKEGEAFYQEEQYKEAVSSLDKALYFDSKNLSALNLRAKAKYALKDTIGYLKDLASAFSVRPKKPKDFGVKAHQFFHFEEYDSALVYLNKELIEKENYQDLYLRGTIHYKNNNYGYAISDFKKALSFDDSDSVNVYKALSKSYLKISDYFNALYNISNAIDIDPNQKQFFRIRALIHMDNENYKYAIEDYNKYLKFDSLNPAIYINMAIASKATNDLNRAIKNYKKVKELKHPREHETLNEEIAILYYHLGNTTKSCEFFSLLKNKDNYLLKKACGE